MGTPLYQHGRLEKPITGGEKVHLTNRVQLFDFVHGNPQSGQWLEPGTIVTIDRDETRKVLKKGFKFVYVTAPNGQTGFIPKWIVNDLIYAWSKENRELLTGGLLRRRQVDDGRAEESHRLPARRFQEAAVREVRSGR